jgi:hypothetical protein
MSARDTPAQSGKYEREPLARLEESSHAPLDHGDSPFTYSVPGTARDTGTQERKIRNTAWRQNTHHHQLKVNKLHDDASHNPKAQVLPS